MLAEARVILCIVPINDRCYFTKQFNLLEELILDYLVFNFWDQYHPDMNKSPGAEEKFKEISAAYEVILALE